MKRIVKLTESDLTRIVRRVLRESEDRIPKDDSSKIIYSDFKSIDIDLKSPRDGSTKEERDRVYKECLDKQKYLLDMGDEAAYNNEKENCRRSVYEQLDFKTYDDIIHGYYKRKGEEEEIYVMASLEGRYTNGSVDNMKSSILYNCNDKIIEYRGLQPRPKYMDNNDPLQQKRDIDWLSQYCNLNWNSRVGKKKNMFRREVLDISDITDKPKPF
jgi:hypothetical protein